MKCGNCKLGKVIQIVSDNTTEHSCNTYIRCPFENNFYKNADDECCYPKTAYRVNTEHGDYLCSLCREVLHDNSDVCPGCNATIIEKNLI